MASEHSKILLPTVIERNLKNVLEGIGLKQYRLKLETGTRVGDNHMGEIVNVTVETESDERKLLQFIVKCSPQNKDFRKAVGIAEMYRTETYVYQKVLPEFLEIQTKYSLKKVYYPFAICYKTIIYGEIECLIMRDMRELGYKMQNRKKPLDYEHVLLVMRSYGKLHALSFALKYHSSEKFREFAENLKDYVFCNRSDLPSDYYKKISQTASDALDRLKEKELKEKFDKFRDGLDAMLQYELSEKAAGKYAVIGHGDSWTNNMLFKYEDSSNCENPTELIFLDWQFSRVCSPAVDLNYFIFICTDKELRDKHYKHFLNEYYESLSSFLQQFGCNPDILFPREVFEEHVKKFYAYGLYMTGLVLLLMLGDEDEVPDLKNMEGDVDSAKLKFKIRAQAVYDKRMRDVIQDIVHYGLL